MKGRQIHKTGLGTVPSQCSRNIHDNSTQCNPGQNLVLEENTLMYIAKTKTIME